MIVDYINIMRLFPDKSKNPRPVICSRTGILGQYRPIRGSRFHAQIFLYLSEPRTRSIYGYGVPTY